MACVKEFPRNAPHRFFYRGSRFLIATLSLQNRPIWLAPPSNDWSNARQIPDPYNLITFEEGRLFGELITAPPQKILAVILLDISNK